jgi:hypothetical protein
MLSDNILNIKKSKNKIKIADGAWLHQNLNNFFFKTMDLSKILKLSN